MEKLVRLGSENTPKINFDPESGMFEISGKSIPEDSLGFYQPILEWLKEYVQNPAHKTTFAFKLEYFNTSSSKLLLDLFYILEEISDSLELNWYCDEGDEDLEESAQDFDEVLDFDINIIRMSSSK